MTSSRARPLRTDARRNRDAIVVAARALFEAEGIAAPIDGIAAAAGVGNATLYRNFPTRDDLLAAVIDDSIVGLLDASRELDDHPDPEAALGEWMFRLVWALRLWSDLPTCIAGAVESPVSPVQSVCARLTSRTEEFLVPARARGAVDPRLGPDAVFELLTAASWAVDRFSDDEDAARDRVTLMTRGVFRG